MSSEAFCLFKRNKTGNGSINFLSRFISLRVTPDSGQEFLSPWCQKEFSEFNSRILRWVIFVNRMSSAGVWHNIRVVGFYICWSSAVKILKYTAVSRCLYFFGLFPKKRSYNSRRRKTGRESFSLGQKVCDIFHHFMLRTGSFRETRRIVNISAYKK